MRVLVTRQHEQAGEFVNLLSDKRLLPYVLPLIETVPARGVSLRYDTYDYLVVTSANTVRTFAPYFSSVKADTCIAVGTATGAALSRTTGRTPDMIPEQFSAEGILALLEGTDLSGKRFLIPGAAVRASNITEVLTSMGAEVDAPVTYETVHAHYPSGHIPRFVAEHRIDIITLCSPSAAESLYAQCDLDTLGVQYVAIGKTTADMLKKLGVDSVYPQEYTLKGMAELIASMHSV